MSTNAARRVPPHPVRRREAAIFRLPVAGRSRAAEQGAADMEPAADAAAPRGDLLVPILLAVLLVTVCLAWEALSGGL